MTNKGQKPATGRTPSHGRGNGRGKARRKQREWRDHCRSMRTSGYITTSEGNWIKGTPEQCRGTTEK